MTELKPLFDRVVSHQDALNAAHDLIDHFFKNEPRKGGGVLISIPVRADNTDMILTDYIKQQMARTPDPALIALVGELVGALEPFVREADEWDKSVADNIVPMICHPFEQESLADAKFSIGDLIKARATLTRAKETIDG